MPITTNTDFSRSSCSTARAVSSPPFFDPPSGPAAMEIKPFLRRLLRAIRANWPNTEILLRADSHYCGPEVLDWCRANGLDYILGVAPTPTLRRQCRGSPRRSARRQDLEAAPREGKVRRFKEFLERREKLEPRRANHRPRRSGRGRIRHALRRHQSEQTQRSRALRRRLLPARTGRKPHQILEDASGGGSHLMHQGDRQSASAFPARRRLLADVGASGRQCRNVRCGASPMPDTLRLRRLINSDRRTGRRDEDDDPGALANVMPRAGYFALRSRTHTRASSP